MQKNKLRQCFDAWRIDSYYDYKQGVEDYRPVHYADVYNEHCSALDRDLEALKAAIDELTLEIKMEVWSKDELTVIYENEMNRSVANYNASLNHNKTIPLVTSSVQ